MKTATVVVDEIIEKERKKEQRNNTTKKGEKIYEYFKQEKGDNRALYSEASKWLGTPYKFGGESLKGTDCSGMVMKIYKTVYGVSLERNSAKMYKNNCRDIPIKQIKEGDLVFFSSSGKKGSINHVGLYLKDERFVHASSSKGVIVSSLNEPYYKKHIVAAGRVIYR